MHSGRSRVDKADWGRTGSVNFGDIDVGFVRVYESRYPLATNRTLRAKVWRGGTSGGCMRRPHENSKRKAAEQFSQASRIPLDNHDLAHYPCIPRGVIRPIPCGREVVSIYKGNGVWHCSQNGPAQLVDHTNSPTGPKLHQIAPKYPKIPFIL
jgi:hypothetical protein